MAATQAVLVSSEPPHGCLGGALGNQSLIELGEDAARRLWKRRKIVAVLRESRLYARAQRGGNTRADQLQPNPDDVTISKRAWERALRRWKVSLLTMAANEPTEGI